MLPDSLLAQGVLDVTLEDGRIVGIPLCLPAFERWTGPAVEFSFGDKPTVCHGDQPVWAEFKVASLLRDAGWDALVVEAYGGLHFMRDMKRGHGDRGVALPASAKGLLERIVELNGARVGGFFDVFAFRGDAILFAEVKLSKKDRLRAPQKRWIAAALAAGVPVGSLLIVEWRFATPS